MMGALGSATNASNTPPVVEKGLSEDPLQLLEKLHGLMSKGVISEAEFAAKKADILSKL